MVFAEAGPSRELPPGLFVSRIKPARMATCRQVWLHRRLCLRWIRGERGKSELNAGKRQFGHLQLLRPCACPQISSCSTKPHSGCSNARGGRQQESQTIALVDVKPCALLDTVNAPRRMLGRGGDRPGEAVRGKHSNYMPGAGRDGGNIRLWNGSTCGACRRARNCVQRLSRWHLSHTPRSLTRMRSASFPRTAVRS